MTSISYLKRVVLYLRSKDKYLILATLVFTLTTSCAQKKQDATTNQDITQAVAENKKAKGRILFPTDIKVGAERFDKYLPLLEGKNVAVVANQSSMVAGTHLVDTLLSLNIKLKKVFCPEHGFRGTEDAGAHIKDYKDKKTGLPIISLYGNNKKPKPADLRNIDVVVFDLQDVGARFYTYISTMTYVMEACAESNIPFIVLDRPNPNGFYVDGPVLDPAKKSFVGMHPVPVVHGMTVAEYARMVNEEGWLTNSIKADLKWVTVEGYTHNDFYQLPVKPSPNLPNMTSIYLYPSLCFFEGTSVSVGRGTTKPFQLIGHPKFENAETTFTPKSVPGASLNPPYKEVACHGYDLTEEGMAFTNSDSAKISLEWLIKAYNNIPDTSAFFNNYFSSLSGNTALRKQIESGMSEEEIRNTWQPALEKFKKIRKKYLLYEDFE